jgi:hypothetical protein
MDKQQRPVSRKGRRMIIYGLAIALGVCLAVAGFLVSDYKFVALPLIALAIGVVFNILTQLSICNSVKISQSITLANIALVLTFITLALQKYVSILTSPIRSLFPNQSDEFIDQFSIGFYLFWTGVYSQIAAGGFLQTCPSSA